MLDRVFHTSTECVSHVHLEPTGSVWKAVTYSNKKKKPVEGHWMNVSLRFLLSQWNQMVHQTATKAHRKRVKTSFPTIEAVGVLHSSSSDEEMLSVFSSEDADWSDHSPWDVGSDGSA